MAGDRVDERAHRALLRLDVWRHAILTKCGRANRADSRDDDAVSQPGDERIAPALALGHEHERAHAADPASFDPSPHAEAFRALRDRKLGK